LLRLFGAVAFAGVLALAALLNPRVAVRPAYACTGAWPSMDDVARNAHAIAIVRAAEVGGPDYTIGPVTVTPQPTATATATVSVTATGTTSPTTSPTATSTATPSVTDAAPPRPASFDLTGYGAHLVVERVLLGSLPTEVDIDAARRLGIDRDLRLQEQPQLTIRPCPIAFLVPKYEAGQSYVMFLRFEDGGWINTPPMFELNDGVVSAQWGSLSQAAYFAFLEGFVTNPYFPQPGEGVTTMAYDRIDAPLDAFINAIRLARGEIAPPQQEATAVPSATSGATRISPPDTGDADLR
jgi:hypothetical protein